MFNKLMKELGFIDMNILMCFLKEWFQVWILIKDINVELLGGC